MLIELLQDLALDVELLISCLAEDWVKRGAALWNYYK
jgi:hypothetical protein